MPARCPLGPQKEAGGVMGPHLFLEPNSGPYFFTCGVLTPLNHRSLEHTALYSLQNLLTCLLLG